MSTTVAKKRKLSETKVELRMPNDLLTRLDEWASRVGLTRSALIRLALTEWMDAKEEERSQRGD